MVVFVFFCKSLHEAVIHTNLDILGWVRNSVGPGPSCGRRPSSFLMGIMDSLQDGLSLFRVPVLVVLHVESSGGDPALLGLYLSALSR